MRNLCLLTTIYIYIYILLYRFRIGKWPFLMQYKHQTLVLGFNIIRVSFSLSNMKSPSILNFAISRPFFCMLFFFFHSESYIWFEKLQLSHNFLTLVTQILIPVDCLICLLKHQHHLMGRPIFTNLLDGFRMIGSWSISWVCTLFL